MVELIPQPGRIADVGQVLRGLASGRAVTNDTNRIRPLRQRAQLRFSGVSCARTHVRFARVATPSFGQDATFKNRWKVRVGRCFGPERVPAPKPHTVTRARIPHTDAK